MTIYILIDEMGHEIDRSKDKVRIEKALSNNPECKIIKDKEGENKE